VNTQARSVDDTETWLSQSERGSLLGIRFFYAFATALGRGPTRLLVALIAFWYSLFSKSVTRASRQWLGVVLGRPVRWRDVYRHVRYFAQTAADRMFLVQGMTGAFTTTRTGHQYLEDAVAAKTGAILLGAHVGSFEAMRAGSSNTNLPLTILGHFENAKMINALLSRLDPKAAARVIHISAHSVDFIFAVQGILEKGELLGTMGDRVGLNEKSVMVTFFGRPARFPTGPFVLASVLKCPVFLTLGLYREPNGYDLHCEPLMERVLLSRKNRDKDLQAMVQLYASRLEHYCRQSPFNWFNFYDFWAIPEGPVAVPDDELPANANPRAPARAPNTDRIAPSVNKPL
jgi:predicted LPLAT superfamily acyltransferase